MNILFFCTTWGQKVDSWSAFFDKITAAGYDGVETDMPALQERDEFLNGLNQYNLKYIGQHWETVTANFDAHKVEYQSRLEQLAALQPMLINSHTGKDFFSFQQNAELIQLAAEVEQASGIPIAHETHRGRFAFAAHVTEGFIDRSPNIKLTLDVSHWCNVAESLLQDQLPAVEKAINHTVHIHARVGFEQGPQVFDPSDNAAALDFHLACWDKVVNRHKKRGSKELTITTEFGPAPYMPGHQNAGMQWEYNSYMLKLLKTRYN